MLCNLMLKDHSFITKNIESMNLHALSLFQELFYSHLMQGEIIFSLYVLRHDSIEIKKSVDFKVSFLTVLLQFEAVQLR